MPAEQIVMPGFELPELQPGDRDPAVVDHADQESVARLADRVGDQSEVVVGAVGAGEIPFSASFGGGTVVLLLLFPA